MSVLIIVLAGVVTAGLSWLVGRFVPVERRRRYHDVGGAMFGQVGTLVSVLVAFIFSGVWSEYRTAEASISAECGALHGAAMVARALPSPEREKIMSGLATYARTVADDEWPLLAEGRRSPAAIARLEDLVSTASTPGGTAADVVARSKLLDLLLQAHQARETRIFQSHEGMSVAAWATLLAIFFVQVGLTVFAGVETPLLMTLASCFVAATVAVLVLVRMLDFPFAGALAIGNEDFVRLFAELSTMNATAGRL